MWLILPSVVFFLLVAAFIIKLAKPPSNSTQILAASPTPIVYPAPTPWADTGLSSLVLQIAGWQAVDPHLVFPAFERKISLPAE